LCRQPPEKLLAIVPGYIFDRIGASLEDRRIGAHHLLPLGLRYLIPAHVEWLADCNLVLWTLVLAPSPLVIWRAHRERSRLNHYKVHPCYATKVKRQDFVRWRRHWYSSIAWLKSKDLS
jgi:hypothetical protein